MPLHSCMDWEVVAPKKKGKGKKKFGDEGSNFFELLPKDLINQLFHEIGLGGLYELKRTCKSMYKMVSTFVDQQKKRSSNVEEEIKKIWGMSNKNSSTVAKITIKYQEHWFALADFLVEVLKQRQLDIKQYSNLRSKPLELNSPDQQSIVDWIKKNNCRPLKNRMLYLLECLPILDSKEYLASLQEMQEDFETRTSHRQKRGVEKKNKCVGEGNILTIYWWSKIRKNDLLIEILIKNQQIFFGLGFAPFFTTLFFKSIGNFENLPIDWIKFIQQ